MAMVALVGPDPEENTWPHCCVGLTEATSNDSLEVVGVSVGLCDTIAATALIFARSGAGSD